MGFTIHAGPFWGMTYILTVTLIDHRQETLYEWCQISFKGQSSRKSTACEVTSISAENQGPQPAC